MARMDGHRSRHSEDVGTRSSAVGHPDPLLTNPVTPGSHNWAVVSCGGRRLMIRSRRHRPDRSDDHPSPGSTDRIATFTWLYEKSCRTPVRRSVGAGRTDTWGVIMHGCPLASVAAEALTQGLRQFAARPNWRPAVRIFTAGQGLRDASGQRPCLTWDVTARGSTYGNRFAAFWPVTGTLAVLARQHFWRSDPE